MERPIRYFRDRNGSDASISAGRGKYPFRLRICAGDGRCWCNRTYRTYRSAIGALVRQGESWEEVTA